MPTESLGIEVKLSNVDMDPKTYSPMSGSDENMSSPPSVLTTASAGSCTPSSLPSAGSTPSSIPSAGSTPYQFVSHEESTIIKPLTPSDMQSLPPSTPDQPITPEPSGQLLSNEMQTGTIPEYTICKKNILAGLDPGGCILQSNERSPGISDDLNERRDDCLCIMCDDKQTMSLQNLSYKDSKELEVQCSDIAELNLKSDKLDLEESPKKKISKSKVPQVQEKSITKARRKNRPKPVKNKAVHYQSEISGDPESTSIKIKIKLTSTCSSVKQNSSNSKFVATKVTVPPPNSNKCLTDPLAIKPTRVNNKGLKRRSSEIPAPNYSSKSIQNTEGRKRKKTKVIEEFTEWGPPLSEVNGEPQSDWAYRIPPKVLENIFLYVTYSEGCIPFLHRASKVCRLWRGVSVMPGLWHSVDLSTALIRPKCRNERKLLWIIENYLSKVEDLNLAGLIEAVTPFILQKISELCPQLKVLNISSCCELHSENISSLLSHSENLERLDLTNIMGALKPTPRCAVGQQTLSELATFLNKKLTHLSIADNTISNVPSIITSLSTHCSQLQVLDLSNVETIGRDCVRLDIEKLQNGCPLLRILRLANSLFRLCQSSMTVQASSPGFPQLEELSLAVDDKVNIGMNDLELERILKNSNKLRLLDVRGCHNITDSSLVRIPPWDIEHLFLAGGSTPRSYSDRLELVVRKWQHSLNVLDLSWTGSSEAIDTAVLALGEEENDKLQSLNLCGSSVNFVPVKNLLKKCTALHWLNLTSCRAMPRGVKRLYDNIRLVNELKSSIEKGKYDEPPPDAD